MEKILYTEIPKKETLIEYISALFSVQVHHYNYGKFWYKCVPSYTDENLKHKHCNSARRSFEDIYSMVLSKYPEETKENVAKTLYELSLSEKMVCIFCPDILKVVFFKSDTASSSIYKMANGERLNYLGQFDDPGIGEYSLKNILDLAGFENDYERANGEKQLIQT